MNAPARTGTANLPAERKPSYGSVAIESHGGGGMLRPSSLGEVVDFAQLMAKADVAVPKHLRGNVGACVSVAMQAFRWEMDPFAVANKSYSVNDRLAYEAQLCAAVVNMRAPIVGRPDYVYTGEGPSRVCQVVCVMQDGEVREYTSPCFDKITTKNSPLWKSDPDQQLGYFAIRSWARRHTPEVLLGVYTPEELAQRDNIRDVTPQATGIRARLAGPQGEGFTSAHAERTDAEAGPDGDGPVDFAQRAEQVADQAEVDLSDPCPTCGAAAGDPCADDCEAVDDQTATFDDTNDFPGDRPAHPLNFDIGAWADDAVKRIDAFEAVKALDAYANDLEVVAGFRHIEAEAPTVARSLESKLNGRRKMLLDRERS